MIYLSNLFELYEKDFITDSLALRNIARRISGNKEILISFNQNSNIAFTDGNFIYLPEDIKYDIQSSQGLVAHESGHIGYGSYELSFINLVKTLSKKHTLPEYIVKKIVNVVEDVRINGINNMKFPGFYKNLRIFTKKLIPDLKIRMKKSGDILIYINLYMENYQDFQKKPKFRTKVMSSEDWNSISVAKTFLLKTLTPASSIITIDQLCKVLTKYYRKKRVSRILPKSNHSSQINIQKQIYDNEIEYDINESKGILYKENEAWSVSEEVIDPDFLEDPFYYEDSESISYRDFYSDEKSILNHYEDFCDRNNVLQETELNITSEELIEKLKHSDLSTENIEKFIDKIESIKEKQNNKNSSDINKDIDDLDNSNYVENDEKLGFNSYKELYSDNYLNKIQNTDINDFEGLISNTLDEIKRSSDNSENQGNLEDFIELISDAHNAMEDRLFILEKGINFKQINRGERERKIKETRIENESMNPINISYKEIIRKYRNLITQINFIFNDFKNQIDIDNFQKKGRLNNKFIKAITSDYKYKKCFSRRIKQKELKILLLVDISGSMKGIKLESAKIAMIMLCEALYEIAQLRIVLFTGDYDAINIILKDFNEKPNPRKFDKFGCHANVCSNLDGISIKHEASKLDRKVLIIVISDGQPAGSGNYGLQDAIKEIQDVKKRFKVFAFSIDANGDYLDKLYDKNWILAKSSDKTDLGDKLVKFCRLVIKEFFR